MFQSVPHEVLVSREIYKHVRVLKGREYSLARSCRAVLSKSFREQFGQPKRWQPGSKPIRWLSWSVVGKIPPNIPTMGFSFSEVCWILLHPSKSNVVSYSRCSQVVTCWQMHSPRGHLLPKWTWSRMYCSRAMLKGSFSMCLKSLSREMGCSVTSCCIPCMWKPRLYFLGRPVSFTDK